MPKSLSDALAERDAYSTAEEWLAWASWVKTCGQRVAKQIQFGKEDGAIYESVQAPNIVQCCTQLIFCAARYIQKTPEEIIHALWRLQHARAHVIRRIN